MSSAKKSAAPIVTKMSSFNISKLGLDTDKIFNGKTVSVPFVYHGTVEAPPVIQADGGKITQFGISPINPEFNIRSDKERLFINLPMDPADDKWVRFERFFTELDSYYENFEDELLEIYMANLAKHSPDKNAEYKKLDKKFIYRPLVRAPGEPKTEAGKLRPQMNKIKIAFRFVNKKNPEENTEPYIITTQFFKEDEDKQIKVESVTELTKHIRLGTVLNRMLIALDSLWFKGTISDEKVGKEKKKIVVIEYGIRLKLIMVQFTPSMGGGAGMYDGIHFLPDGEENSSGPSFDENDDDDDEDNKKKNKKKLRIGDSDDEEELRPSIDNNSDEEEISSKKKKKSRREEQSDEEESPKRKKKSRKEESDDEDDAPKKKSKRKYDSDEEESPRKKSKKKSRRDDDDSDDD